MFSVITVNFAQIGSTDPTQQENILLIRALYGSAVLIIAAIALLVLFAKDFVKDLDRLLLHECVPRDTTILRVEKIVKIGPDAKANGCNITEIREIQNNMPHDYNRYLFARKMSQTPPPFEKFKFYLDNEKKPKNYSENDVNFEVMESSSRDPDVLKYRVEYKFPVQAKPHETKTMKVEQPTYSFSDALNGKMDWIEFDVNAITEKMKFEIELVDGMEDDYYLDYPSSPKDNDGAIYDIEIRDYSRQRMWNSEANLKNEKIMPTFSGFSSCFKMSWVVYHPKIGYKYRMYFTLKKKVEPVTEKQITLSRYNLPPNLDTLS